MKSIPIIVIAGVMAGFSLSPPCSASADLEGRVEITSGNLVPPGTVARVVVTIINNGPDAAVDVAAGTYYFANFQQTIEVFPTAETAPCVVRYTDLVGVPGQPTLINVDIRPFADLAAGGSLSCVVGLTTDPEAPPIISQRFGVVSPEDDPDPSNNLVFLDIRTRAAATAVPGGSSSAALLLVIGVALTGLLCLRRRMLTLSTASPGGERRAGQK